MKDLLKDNFRYLVLLLAVIIATSAYLIVEHNKIAYREKVRQDNINTEKRLQKYLNDCLDEALRDKNSFWDDTCKDLGKKENCWLPSHNADSVNKSYKEDRAECMDKFRNRAFVDYKNWTDEEIKEYFDQFEEVKQTDKKE